MIAIIDYDAGNIGSVQKAITYLGEEVIVTRKKSEILMADKVILPGVGAFDDAMQKFIAYDLQQVLKEVISRKTPLLGICLGLQLLFESSEEGTGTKGLGIFPGAIRKIPNTGLIKIPHIGWNSLEINPNARLFQGIPNHSYVYFVHSYYLHAKDTSIVSAITEYGTTIHAAIEHENVYACQFHPEKSGEVGLQILKNFAKL